MTAPTEALAHFLRRRAPVLFAVVDAARDAGIYPWLRQSTITTTSLFSGTTAITLAECAPYLVQLCDQPHNIEKLLDRLWGHSCLLLLESEASEEQVRLALKKCLAVSLPNGVTGLFRYYDPRVFRRFMAVSNDAQRRLFFSHVRRYWLENETGDSVFELINGPATFMQRVAGVSALQGGEIPLAALAARLAANPATGCRT